MVEKQMSEIVIKACFHHMHGMAISVCERVSQNVYISTRVTLPEHILR